ncbi:Chromobox 3 [Amphibalanus amphitrite]|uniref:Chromobox 3 n=1 Tax=Amphibalanus amphitrite TaxID=1232801 RepID=A0A6A4WI85_AMPAM|nr:Chromobox 3 [Amphibalanus amphitrite]
MGSKKAAEKFHVCRKHLRGRRDTMTRDQRISFLKRMRDFYQVRDAGKTKTPAAAPAQRSRPPSTRPSKPRPSFGEALMLPETAMISPPRRRAETDSPQPSGDPASRLLSEAEVCVVLDELRAGQSTTAITGRYKITRNWLTRFSDEYAAGRSDKDIYQLYVRTASARTDQDNIARAVALVLKGHSVKKIARQSNLGVNVLNYHIKKHRERQAATGGAGDQAKPTGEVAAAAGAPEARPERLTKTALRHLIRKLMDCAETDVSGKAELESQLALPQRHVNRLLQMASRKGTAPAAVFSLYCRLWREAGDEKATTTSSRKDSLAASVLAHGPGGDGPGAVRDGPPGSKDEPVAESGPAAKDAPATDANKPASKKDEPAVKDDSGDPGAAATAPADGTPSGDTPGRSRRQRRPPKHLEGYLDVAVPSPERPAAPAEPAVADLCARAESAARAAFAVERGVCLPSEAPARFKVTPEELAEASRALGNMPLIKKKLNTLGMRRAVAAVLRGHTQQWAVSMCKVTPMGLWKTLKRLRQAGLIGQHIGKRRFIGGDSEPAPSKDDSADGTADETSQEAPMEDASSAATADDSDDSDTEQQVSDDEVPMGDSLDLSNLEPNMLAAVKAVLSGDSKALAAKKYRVERKDLIETLRKRAVTPIGVLGSTSPAVDPSSISDVMRKAIGSVILGKMCVKAASTLHRVPFGQLKSLCQSMTARYDSKGAVVVEAASEVPPPQSTSVAASPAQPQAPTSPAPSPAAAEPPPGHIWDNRNGTWILEKDGKQQAFFEVDTILARREAATDGSQPEYLIRWKGYTDAWNTWEPEGNLECTDTLAAFQRRWDTVAEEERRRIIAEFSPVAPAPGLAPAAAAAATPAAQQRKGRPPKMCGRQTTSRDPSNSFAISQHQDER